MWIGKPSDLIGKILSPALRLWLRTQVEQVEELQIRIEGRDRQILSGHVPEVSLNSRKAIYQGLHLGNLALTGQNIRINIRQVIAGKPLQLLEPIQVGGEIYLEQKDLQASLSSSILHNAFRDLLIALLELNGTPDPEHVLAPYQIQWDAIHLDGDRFTLTGAIASDGGTSHPLKLEAALGLLDPQTLQLSPIALDVLPELAIAELAPFEVNLGEDVELDALRLGAGELFCQGRLLIRPAATEENPVKS